MARAKKAAKKAAPAKKAAKKAAPAKKAAKKAAPAKKAAKKAAPAKKAAKKGAKKAAKRAAPKRAARKRASTRGGPPAALRWKLQTGDCAFGIHAGADSVWVSNDAGDVHVCDRDGVVQRSLKLPDGAKCIIADEHWIYAGTEKGVVYDLTGNIARAVYQVAGSADILWMDIYQGNLCVADDAGGVSVYDPGEVLLWDKRDPQDGNLWMIRADAQGVYAGGDRRVCAFDWGGEERWSVDAYHVLFGAQTASAVYASNRDSVTGITKSGEKLVTCEGPTFPSCATTPDGSRIFGGCYDNTVRCFDAEGKQLWALATTCGSPLSMQYRDETLYIVTDEGFLAAIDVSSAAVERALASAWTAPAVTRAPKLAAATRDESTHVESTREVGDGVLVECFKDQGKLRVRVLSDGYKSDWFVQFPRDIREAGAKYVVDKVLVATQGGFYRALGNIRRLEE